MNISLFSPLDMHLHLREGDMLQTTTPLSARYFSGGVIMPNLIDPVDTETKLLHYRDQIKESCGNEEFEPYMTLFFKQYGLEELEKLKPHIIGIKLYPAGITTQSEGGVTDFSNINETLSIMQELSIPLLVHGESSGFVMKRESEFMTTYRKLAESYPELHIIMEHITTADAVDFLDEYENVSATVTLHHLMITLDDVIGGLMKPHLFCKPIAKTPYDRERLRSAVFSGHPKIMFGSDSAPHPKHKKECCGCAAGIFTAPISLLLLTELFEQEGCLELLQNFISGNAIKRYGIQPPEKVITLEKVQYQVPEMYGNIKPFYAGQTISWNYA